MSATPLPDCHPDFVCTWHGVCAQCGQTIHLATMEESSDLRLDEDSVARFICGDPPRCADCRGVS
jgi:hypothetical protein